MILPSPWRFTNRKSDSFIVSFIRVIHCTLLSNSCMGSLFNPLSLFSLVPLSRLSFIAKDFLGVTEVFSVKGAPAPV